MPTSYSEVHQIKEIMDSFLCASHGKAITTRLIRRGWRKDQQQLAKGQPSYAKRAIRGHTRRGYAIVQYIVNMVSVNNDKSKIVTVEASSCSSASAQALSNFPSYEILRVTSADHAVKYFDTMNDMKNKKRAT